MFVAGWVWYCLDECVYGIWDYVVGLFVVCVLYFVNCVFDGLG